MRRKYVFLIIISLIFIFIGFSFYNSRDINFTIDNNTDQKIDTITVVSDKTKNTISVDKFSTLKIKLPKNTNNSNLIYSYNKNESSESFEIINKELNIKHSKLSINALDKNGKFDVTLK